MARTKLLARALIGASAVSYVAFLAAGDATAANPNWPLKAGQTADDAKNPMFWPDDPDWGYQWDANANKKRSGQWQYFGFQPDRSPGAPPLRDAEVGKPSGISVDLAWRVTIGDPSIHVAILDSGPKWDEADIANKAFLNVGELKNHPPHTKDGKACNGKGPNPTFDCNGDGAVSTADYADEPSLKPDATMGHPKGDKNNNGILDAGDLILNFTDGVDDDGNGYVDDISGWDFLMDDNDPYEDTRYYHGTNQARDAAADTNNGIGGAGVCPLCQFMPLRVGDSFIADANGFAKAVAYATDMKASAIECALGTVNNTAYAQSAVEYAYNRGVLVSGSMADENSRHHNMPNTANYILSAHAIENDDADGDPTRAKSFLTFEPGTNYGGNNYLSTTTEAASSGAAGINSGIMGLLHSAALQYGFAPLSANETMQLMIMTADDIDVPESRMPGAKTYYSQPGFDQRFGYGRVNAGTAAQWVKDGKIPPEVNVIEPLWFQNIYKDRQVGPVDIKGTISAKRAPSYDYRVEWAPGVHPLETEWKAVTSQQNVAGSTVMGANGTPLAQLDVSKMDVTHPPDSDSGKGENQWAFTVRIHATAHYGGAVGDVPGEYRRTYYLQTDPDLLPGFPIRLDASAESSPKLADMDGDGVREIVMADNGGKIHAWKVGPSGPKELPGFPFLVKRVDGLEDTPLTPGTADYKKAKAYQPGGVNLDVAREGMVSTVAVADVDGDGKPEIAATTWNGTVYLIGSDGKAKPGWPVRMPYVPSCPLDPTVTKPVVCMDVPHDWVRGAGGSPVLVDMNKDGRLDVVQAGFDGNVYVWDTDGKLMPGWPVPIHYDARLADAVQWNRIFTTPAVADLNGDGIPEVLTGSSEKIAGADTGAFYVIDGRGTNTPGTDALHPGLLPNWPITVPSVSVLPILGEGVTTSGLFADVDGDGKTEVIFHGNLGAPLMLPADPGVQAKLNQTPPNAMPLRGKDDQGNELRGVEPTSIFGELSAANKDTMFPLFSHPSVGDLDMDGSLDVIAGGGSLSLLGALSSKTQLPPKPPQFLVSMWSSKTGKMLPGSPFPMEDYMFINSQAIADITGDGYPEVFTGSGGYLLHSFDACGREAKGFPKNTGQWILATTAIGDIDGDKKLEVVVGTRDGWLYAWHTDGSSDGVIQWESWHHDNQNTGNYGTKLTQGTTKKAGLAPLDCGVAAGGSGGASGGTGGGTTGTGGNAASGTSNGLGGVEVTGGCSVAEGGGGGASLAWIAAAIAGLAARRRRMRGST